MLGAVNGAEDVRNVVANQTQHVLGSADQVLLGREAMRFGEPLS